MHFVETGENLAESLRNGQILIRQKNLLNVNGTHGGTA